MADLTGTDALLDRIAELEAKLEKAVDAVTWLEAEIKDNGFPKEGPMRSKCRAALAELKGTE